MEQNEFDDKIKYAQNIINILQTRLNESVAQNVQLEATVTILKDEKEKLTKELADASSNKTEEK
jgi:methyl coenzyme M reductase subunit D